MILKRTDQGEYAKSIFFHSYNEIDVYVEDTSLGYKKIYTELLKRVLKDDYRIHSIFPLGSRDSVINFCKTHRKDRPFVFIVDADLYQMSGEDDEGILKLEGLFVLEKYCIENYLIDVSALLELLHEEDVEKDIEEITKLFSYDEWLEKNKKLLVDLFVEYAIAFSLVPEIQTVSYRVSNLTLSRDGDLCNDKIIKRTQDIKNEIIEITGEQLYGEMKNHITHSIKTNECMLLKYVSAKDYIIPLLFLRMRTMFKLKSTNINWKVRLSMKCDISSLSDIKVCIST